jgi:hypothetical protein
MRVLLDTHIIRWSGSLREILVLAVLLGLQLM